MAWTDFFEFTKAAVKQGKKHVFSNIALERVEKWCFAF